MIGAQYNAGAFSASAAGAIEIIFNDASQATMIYNVDGVTQSKTIARLRF